MAWVALLRTVLAIANAVADIVRNKQLLDAGEARATARSIAELSHRLTLGRQITRQIEDLTDDEINARLRGDK